VGQPAYPRSYNAELEAARAVGRKTRDYLTDLGRRKKLKARMAHLRQSKKALQGSASHFHQDDRPG
jgi:hypothetical protein